MTDPVIWAMMAAGVTVGIIFGSIPGLTATMAITMCLPITFSMDALHAIPVLIALYVGGISGGLISAILLNIPGTPSSIATTFDGSPMAKKGHAARALGIGVVYSFLGTIFGLLCLLAIAPQLARIAIKFGPFDYCAISIFSLSLVIALAGKDFLKGIISAVLGIMFATVGLSPLDSMKRFTFGRVELNSGFMLLTVLIGLYAITEIADAAYTAVHPKKVEILPVEKAKWPGFTLAEFVGNLKNFFVSAVIGTGIGILPGIGGGTAGMLAYTVQKTSSKDPEKYGTGCMEGIVASETSNNAVIGGAMVPLLSLGIPGDGATAMLLGGLLIHGVSVGPLVFQKSGDVVYAIYAAMMISSFMMLIIESAGMKAFIRILKVPRNYLLPVVVVMCAIGAFGNTNRAFDVMAVMIFGLIGYLMVKTELPAPPFVLGFILGPMFEENFRRASQYVVLDARQIYKHPIADVFVVMAVVVVFVILRSRKKQAKKEKAENAQQAQ